MIACDYRYYYCIVGTPQLWGGAGGGLSFQNFRKKGGSDFSHKKGGVGKIGAGGVLLKKGGGITYFHTNSFQCYLSLSVWCVYVCFAYLHEYYLKNLAL